MEQNEHVEYKLVPHFPKYRVGSDGTVWRFLTGRKRQPCPKWKQLKTPLHGPLPAGRPVVNITNEHGIRHVYLGRLVLEVFVGPPPTEKHQCCHFPDRNPLNCCISNLRWGTGVDNNLDQVIHGTRVVGLRHPRAKLSDEDRNLILALKGTASGKELADRFGVSRHYIYLIWGGFAKRWINKP